MFMQQYYQYLPYVAPGTFAVIGPVQQYLSWQAKLGQEGKNLESIFPNLSPLFSPTSFFKALATNEASNLAHE